MAGVRNREDRTFSMAGSIGFVVLPSVSILAQHWLLNREGARTIVKSLNSMQSFHIFSRPPVPFAPRTKILLALTAAQGIRRCIWAFHIAPWRINFIFDGLFTVGTTLYFGGLAWASLYAPHSLGWKEYVGVGAFAIGSIITTGSEIQRKQFKDDPKNQGKPYTEGLFSIAQHINYTGEILQWVGNALATGTYWPLVIPAFMMFNFYNNLIPEMQEHLKKRYGPTFEQYAKETAKMFPKIW